MSRRRLDVLAQPHHPAYVVWELTLRCDHACTHCGSRAAVARDVELTTAQALRVVDELAALGAREVVLIGGEAYLHEGFFEIVAALARAGVRPTMTTGGKGITGPLAERMATAGLRLCSVSIDGLRATHDRMRASHGSFDRATAALGHLRAAGIRTAANTNVNRLNRADLEPLYEHLRAQGIVAWQVQLTAPLGRAADRPEMILQPWDLLELVPRIVALKRRAFADGIRLMPGNNLGYFGPEEALLRSPTEDGDDHFAGCQAGRLVMGIESDGAIKGCPSLQTHAYAGRSVAEAPLATIWADDARVGSLRGRTVEDLWGFCRTCAFARTCMGGCTFTAHSILGRPGNNPYCHFRARTLAAAGRRERLVPLQRAPGRPFDHGRFALVEEDLDAPDPGAGLDPAQRVALGTRALPVLPVLPGCDG
ncbi:radical SAM/SPASM domain-containing protein [Paraliomyxa miuraensis]|uniref:radical SAM/SPASM domain-containing protein n=1 Tax=Paraliomyxa miuraensis TaxID=376150 RepID=UPI00225B7207|nr:radical SAM protein [Paraliomyxa miuraensis]MCX4241378.1 radical SAM protein [Paraliomyxa miuraensis]